jgi:hypothetical protein
MKQGTTHWANIGVLCNVRSYILILLGQRHTEQQSITSLLTNATLSVNKRYQQGEDYKSAIMKRMLTDLVQISLCTVEQSSAVYVISQSFLFHETFSVLFVSLKVL